MELKLRSVILHVQAYMQVGPRLRESWLPLAAGREFTQPREHLIAYFFMLFVLFVVELAHTCLNPGLNNQHKRRLKMWGPILLPSQASFVDGHGLSISSLDGNGIGMADR